MSRSDVLKSLLRSTARSAATGLARLPMTVTVKRMLAEASIGRSTLSDAQLTKAVARVPHVTAATVSTAADCLRVDASFEDGTQLRVGVHPAGLAFAPGGPKELHFALETTDAAPNSHSRDVLAAIAGEIARSLWRPALVGAPHFEELAFVTAYDDRMVVDLRSVPEVRWALAHSTRAALIEAIGLRSMEFRNSGATLLLRLPFGLRR